MGIRCRLLGHRWVVVDDDRHEFSFSEIIYEELLEHQRCSVCSCQRVAKVLAVLASKGVYG